MNEVEELALDSVASGGPKEVLTEQANNNPDVPEVDPVDTSALPKETVNLEGEDINQDNTDPIEIEPVNDNMEGNDVYTPIDESGGGGFETPNTEELENPLAELAEDPEGYRYYGDFEGDLNAETVNLAGLLNFGNPMEFIQKIPGLKTWAQASKLLNEKKQALQDEVNRINEDVSLTAEEKTKRIREILSEEGVTYGSDRLNYIKISDNDFINDISDTVYDDPLLNDGLIGNTRIFGTKDGKVNPDNNKFPEDLYFEESIAYLVKYYDKAFTAETGGVDKLSFDLMKNMSDITFLTDKKFLKRLLANKPGEIPPMPYILAMRDLFNIETRKLNDMIDLIRSGEDVSNDMLLKARQQYEIVANVQLKISGIKTNLGRAVVSFKRPSGYGPEGQIEQRATKPESFEFKGSDLVEDKETKLGVISEEEAKVMLDTFGGKENLIDFFYKYQDMPEGHRRNRFARDYYRASKDGSNIGIELVNELWINSLLSLPVSHLRNILGNGLMMGKHMIENYALGTVGTVSEKLGFDYGGIKLDEVHASTGAMLLAFDEAIRAFYYGTAPHVGRNNKFDELNKNNNSWSPETFGYASPNNSIDKSNVMGYFDPEAPLMAHMFNAIGKTFNAPTNILNSEDVFFKVLAQRYEITMLAQRTAKSKGLTGSSFLNFVAEFVADPPYEALKESQKFASYMTFQQELGKTAKDAQSFIQRTPMRWALPFFKTPLNIAKVTFAEGSPLALASKEFRRKLISGTARERETAIMRFASGNTLLFGSMMYASGVTTGPDGQQYPNVKAGTLKSQWKDNKRVARNADILEYAPEYSVLRFDGEGKPYYMPIRGLEPFSSWLMLGMDLHKITTSPEIYADNEDDVMQLMLASALAIENSVLNKTFASGADQFIKAIFEPERYGEKYIQNLVASFVPNIFRSGAKVADPTMRQAMDLKDKIFMSIPGLKDNLIPRMDLHGRELKEGKEGFRQMWSPFASKSFTPENLTNLQKDWKLFGGGPTLVKPKFQYNGVTIDFYKEDDGGDLYVFLQKYYAKNYNRIIERKLRSDGDYRMNKKRFVLSNKTDLNARNRCIELAQGYVRKLRNADLKKLLANPRRYGPEAVRIRQIYMKGLRENKLLERQGY